MRHTVHLLLGNSLGDTARLLKKYVLMHGEGDTNNYLQVIGWRKTDALWQAISVEEARNQTDVFYSDFEQQYAVEVGQPVNVMTSDEASRYFTALFTRSLTVNREGDSQVMQLIVYLPLYDNELVDEAFRIIHTLSQLNQQYKVDIVGLCADLSSLFGTEETSELTAKAKANALQVISKEEQPEYRETIHRFFLIQNYTSSGVALNLTQASFVRIIGELAMVFTENYDQLFPQSEELEHTDLTAFGLSVLSFDKYYFAGYLLRQAFLKVLDREKVGERTVDVNWAANMARQCLQGRTQLLSDFYARVVSPMVKLGKSPEEIAAEIPAKLNEEFDALTDNMQEFLSRRDLSLPEKQAVLALILGQDDALLTGHQFREDGLTLEDCYQEPLKLFVDEINRLKDSGDFSDPTFVNLFGEDTTLPHDEDGHIVVPTDRLKELRQRIMQSTAYIRDKSRELEVTARQLELETESEKRLTNGGFVFGGTSYRLLREEDIPVNTLEETYEPKANTKTNVDLRSLFTPIKSQGTVGACTVFSITSVYEYIIKKSRNEENDLSERFVYHNVLREKGSMEDSGSSYNDVIKSIQQYGICTELQCPDIYRFAEPPTSDAYTDAASRTIRQAKNVRTEHASITSALAEGYPVVVSLKIFDSFGNNHGGFIYRPTEAELSGGESGYHAMVIVGYTDEYRLYIVRNSWGTDFGDGGYCYIPYDYIEDTSLNRSCCIITQITDGADAGGLSDDTRLKVSFNSTDAQLRYAVIRNQIESEKIVLARNREEYTRQRSAYELLVQTLCRPDVRKMLRRGTDRRLHSAIGQLQNFYHAQMEQRGTEMEQFNRETRLNLLQIAVFFLIFAAALAFCLYQQFESQSWAYLATLGLAVSGLALLLYPSFRRTERRSREETWNYQLENLSTQRAQTEQELKGNSLRMFLAGMLLDKLALLNSDITETYLTLKSYVGNLAVWREEEAARLEQDTSVSYDPFVMLLDDHVLTDYFNRKYDKLIADVWLCDYLKDYRMNEETIIGYKNKLKALLAQRLFKETDDFSVFSYITRRKDYPYLDHRHSDISKLLPMLDRKSMPFLRYTVKDLAARRPMQRSIFIHTSSDEERALWRETYPHFFQMMPSTAGTVSRFRLVVVQKQDIGRSDALLLADTGAPAEERKPEEPLTNDFSKINI